MGIVSGARATCSRLHARNLHCLMKCEKYLIVCIELPYWQYRAIYMEPLIQHSHCRHDMLVNI